MSSPWPILKQWLADFSGASFATAGFPVTRRSLQESTGGWRRNPWVVCFAILAAITVELFPLASPAAFAKSATNLPSYFTRLWQTQDGLPYNAVTAILQTRDGFLWLATYDGLARFDGVNFTVFDDSNTPELHSSRVTSLFEDNQGNLWIGCESGELTRYRDGHFYSVPFHPAWESRKIQAMGEDSSGHLWLMNPDGKLASLDGRTIAPPNAAAAGPAPVLALAQGPGGAVMIDYNGKVFALHNDRLVSLSLGLPATEYVKWICPSRDGGLWLVTQNQLLKWNGKRIEDFGSSPIGSTTVTAMLEMHTGALAAGTEDGLFLIFPKRGFVHLDRAHGFPNNWVRTLFEDREGTLWVGIGSSGLVTVRPSRVATLTPPDDWQGADVLSITCDHQGALWIGTEGAGLYRLQAGQWTHFGESNGLSSAFVWSVSEDARNRLWVGTWGGGLSIEQSNRFERLPGLADLTAPVLAILHESNGVTWLGTDTGLLRYQAGKVTRYGANKGLVLPDVRAIAQAPNGTLWFGMMGGGLGRLQNGAVKQFRKADGLSSDFVQCLHLDQDGTLWIGTYGGGLDRLQHGHFSAIGVKQGLPSDFICNIQQDEHDNFWICSHAGIFRIRQQDLIQCTDGQMPTIHPLVYGLGDGMPTLECSGGCQPASCRTPDGRLWFSTSKGPVGIDPNHIKVNQLPPPVIVEKMLVNGRPVAGIGHASGSVRIPPGRRRFEFRYTGLSFVAPEKVTFKYRLKGLEREWSDAGTKRSVIYSYIPPGSYEFQVTACNSDGIWNPIGAMLAFTVEPYVWQTWWFRILAGVSAAGLLSGGVLWIARRRMRRNLDRLERQRVIERERTRIARDIHDSLGANLTRISLLSQSAHGELHNPGQAAVQLNRIYDTTRELTRALDEIVWAVNPEHDTLESLANYLGKFSQEFLGPLAIRCRLDLPLQLPPWLVTAEVRHNLFLAFKEALNNIVKHAAASEVFISLVVRTEAFILAIHDNGNGFSTETIKPPERREPGRLTGGHGLANLRRRLAKIGGHCEIRSVPGEGTEVKFLVPVPDDQRSAGRSNPSAPENSVGEAAAPVAKNRDTPFPPDALQ